MKNKILKITVMVCLSLIFLVATENTAIAQCPMCKMSAESNMKNGGTAGKGLNTGILYMFAAPYLLVGGLVFMWYRGNKKKREASEAEEIQHLLE
jgi:hypothetical protein